MSKESEPQQWDEKNAVLDADRKEVQAIADDAVAQAKAEDAVLPENEIEVPPKANAWDLVARALGVEVGQLTNQYEPYKGVHVGEVRPGEWHRGALQGVNLTIFDPHTYRVSESRRVMIRRKFHAYLPSTEVIDGAKIRAKFNELAEIHAKAKARYAEAEKQREADDAQFKEFVQVLGIGDDHKVALARERFFDHTTKRYNLNFREIPEGVVRELVAAWQKARAEGFGGKAI